uniref:Uncharacterized protein n=1 Tax=Arundo donax TaxID=35708 RepID=A0A0A9ENU3_ARUDO
MASGLGPNVPAGLLVLKCTAANNVTGKC